MPQLLDYPRYAIQLLRGQRSAGEAQAAGVRQRDLAAYLDLSSPRRILDLGSGRLRPQYTLLRAQGHAVVGVDLINRPASSQISLAYTVARRLYLAGAGIAPAYAAPTTLVCASVNELPLQSSSFDLMTSIAAFEHFLNVPAVLDETWRVLRPGGLIWVMIHLFTAPSGGHNLSFAEVPLRHVPPGVDAWDHLRKRRVPFSVPLNEWRIRDYLAAFAERFEVLTHYCSGREGELLLTSDIEAELAQSGYTRDELTSGAYVIVARKH